MRFLKRLMVTALAGFVLLSVGGVRAVQGQALPAARPMIGVALALVVDLHDPDNLGRIKVKFPWLAQNEQETFWARVVLPLGGNTTGLWALPEVNDEVLVAFDHGDINRPYVIGSLWNGGACPLCQR